ncbi:peptidase C39 family protein [Amycolatopsis saalfeldensis]|uniref:Peptidase_C39 like family protein n=1 Tax=Amycolatopsis saalfeldensis TaxID=394193 RepID=A0A1H8WLS8_9PSEU|nr:peptidase C39 family protein [Amycolatopsis saalfeldensis]SEP28644.1 Peptidase_C39 like family protein [Amycolatopsis saalfeldensis]
MRARGLVTLMSIAMLTAGATQYAEAAPARPANDEAINYHEWSGPGYFAGRFDGLGPGPGGLRITHPAGTVEHSEPGLGTTKTYDYGTWTSPVFRPGFDATQLIASWNAQTPAKTWLEVEAKGRTSTGVETAWYVMGRWASGDSDIQRTSVDGQSDDNASVDVDTLETKTGVTLRSYQLRVSLYREAGTRVTPTLSTLGAMTSNVPDRFDVRTTKPGVASGIELKVPEYAQNIHKGQFPQYGGGGEAWCSPTSTEMVAEYWGKKPTAQQMSWIPSDYVDPAVVYAARNTYDYAYDGTGNWPFNTAYAASLGLRGHITRLHDLNELEGYIARGIPVITSQSFLSSELDGAGYGTSGHIMVVVGFTKTGDVIVNDPASSSDSRVRNVYKRDQFEKIWQRTKRYTDTGSVAGGPGGVVYLVTPA